MNALGQRIAALIAAQGPISVAEFMTVALHDPQAGYYATHDPFADFTTAPEITQVFGEATNGGDGPLQDAFSFGFQLLTRHPDHQFGEIGSTPRSPPYRGNRARPRPAA